MSDECVRATVIAGQTDDELQSLVAVRPQLATK